MRKAIPALLTAGVLFTALTGAASAQDNNAIPAVVKVTYICERNIELPVVYINNLKNDESMAVIMVDGKMVPMRNWKSASGARYLALDEQDSYRWHTKGDKGVLSYLEADDMAKEQFLLSDCVNKEQSAQQK